jgi:hypothetical protein
MRKQEDEGVTRNDVSTLGDDVSMGKVPDDLAR